jgi:trehalose 6-phosphate synthase/phosphatase
VAALEGLGPEEMRWVGWPGSQVAEDQQRKVAEALSQEFRAAPVFLSNDEATGFYEGFSNSSLWPLLHYMPSRFRYQSEWWEHYRAVNQRFAEQALSVASERDVVWVHDYQLLLLPRMLRKAQPSLQIGLFLHTPFPSYEVFRYHPRRVELLEGMLGADLIGFHTFGYMRHFRSSVLRLLGIESDITRLRCDEREVRLGVHPIGINAGRFADELASPRFAEQVAAVREAYADKRVVLSVERLDYTKGILHRLEAIDLFLRDCTERDRMKFIFISVPSRENVDEYRELREEVEFRIGRLNGTYATLNNSPIKFIHGSINFTELCALYARADVCVVTPLVDGMNLVAKEFCAAQNMDDPEHAPGVLVLSEFAGAAEELFNALIVNPHDAQQVADALKQALGMPAEERRGRIKGMRERVFALDARRWARSFVDDLTAQPTGETATAGDQARDLERVRRRFADALRAGERLAFFLDYDGTLREIQPTPDAAAPSDEVRALLRLLAGQSNIDTTLISGRTAENLEAWLGEYPFGLIAEHGAYVRRPRASEWEQLDRNISYAWKDELLQVLRIYEASTPGSFIENKRTGLVWHYRKADPEFGQWKASALAGELSVLVANSPLEVRHGRKIVEITSSQVNKGSAMSRVLEEARLTYAAVLCAGDDETDEAMFRLNLHNLTAIKVGDRRTLAPHRLPHPAALRRLLFDIIAARPST